MSAAEFCRPVRLDMIGTVPHRIAIRAEAGERAALAARFGLPDIAALSAELVLAREGEAVLARGRVLGRATQACVATGEPVPAVVDETVALRFVAASGAAAGEVELAADDLDLIEHDGQAIDIGEAAAESFALALDPFPRRAEADARLREAGVLREGEEKPGALAGLAALLGKGG